MQTCFVHNKLLTDTKCFHFPTQDLLSCWLCNIVVFYFTRNRNLIQCPSQYNNMKLIICNTWSITTRYCSKYMYSNDNVYGFGYSAFSWYCLFKRETFQCSYYIILAHFSSISMMIHTWMWSFIIIMMMIMIIPNNRYIQLCFIHYSDYKRNNIDSNFEYDECGFYHIIINNTNYLLISMELMFYSDFQCWNIWHFWHFIKLHGFVNH